MMWVCVHTHRFPTQQVLHALSRLDDLGADWGTADAVQDVIGFGDDLNVTIEAPAIILYTKGCIIYLKKEVKYSIM